MAEDNQPQTLACWPAATCVRGHAVGGTGTVADAVGPSQLSDGGHDDLSLPASMGAAASAGA